MKLVMSIVQSDDAGQLIDSLVARGHRVTRINTAGGFLKQSNATILVGVDDDQAEAVLAIISENCQTRVQLMSPTFAGSDMADFATLGPVEVQVGGATAWVLPVDQVVRL
jgi:uncharacterized protein YaaQ